MVALAVSDSVSAETEEILSLEGWHVRRVSAISNPGRWTGAGAAFPPRFWAVYTKLLAFNLTDYDRVVYLDADTIVRQSLDLLFLCDGFCAVMRHSERLNSGVMVLQPSARRFQDMLARVASTPSYTGGDQGFLNEYFADFARAPLFEPHRSGRLLSAQRHQVWAPGLEHRELRGPSLSALERRDRAASASARSLGEQKENEGEVGVDAGAKLSRAPGKGSFPATRAFSSAVEPRAATPQSRLPMGRLPTSFNADLGLYVLNGNRWMVDASSLHVVHYTLAAFKPWDWWSLWLTPQSVLQWQALRARLPLYAADSAREPRLRPTGQGPYGGGGPGLNRLLLAALSPPLILALLLCSQARACAALRAAQRLARPRDRAPLKTPPSARRLVQSLGAFSQDPPAQAKEAALQMAEEGAAAGALNAAAAGALNAAAAGALNAAAGPPGSPRLAPRCSGASPEALRWMALPLLTLCLALSLGVALGWAVPRRAPPAWGWMLAAEWTSLLLGGSLLACCLAASAAGAAAPQTPASRPAQAWMPSALWERAACADPKLPGETLRGLGAVLAVLLLLPAWPTLLGCHSLVPRILLTALAGAPSLALAALAFGRLLALWHAAGRAGSRALGKGRAAVE